MSKRDLYIQIAADDPGGTLAEALAAMSILTDSTSVASVTYDQIAYSATYATAAQLEKKINTGVTNGSFPGWAQEKLNNGIGIDVNNAAISTSINDLVGGLFTQEMADAILAIGVKVKYPGLTEVQIQNSRDHTAGGLI